MAATTKFNRIASLFMVKIGDPITITGNVIGFGKIIKTKAEVEAYVNRALEVFFYKKWEEFKGNVKDFANFFPELITRANNGTVASGICGVEAFRNLFKLFGVRVGNEYVAILDITKYSIVKSGRRMQYVGTADDPIAILVDDQIEFFGVSDSDNVDLDYLVKPLRIDGTAYESSADAEDSPFSEFWTEQIAQIAADLYNQDAQNLS